MNETRASSQPIQNAAALESATLQSEISMSLVTEDAAPPRVG